MILELPLILVGLFYVAIGYLQDRWLMNVNDKC